MLRRRPNQRLLQKISINERLRLLTEEVLKLNKQMQPIIPSIAPTGPVTGGGGATTFLDLTDTPNDYTGNAGLFVKVNDDEDAVEFSNLWSGITTYTPTWACEYHGSGPDVSFPTSGSLVQPAIGNGTLEGFYKYNKDYLHTWGRVILGTTTTIGYGRWVISLPDGFTIPANARGMQGTVFGSRYMIWTGDGAAGGGLFKPITGLCLAGGPEYLMTSSIVGQMSGTDIDMKPQSTTGLRFYSFSHDGAEYDYWGSLDPSGDGSGYSTPSNWVRPGTFDSQDGSSWFEWNIMIPLR